MGVAAALPELSEWTLQVLSYSYQIWVWLLFYDVIKLPLSQKKRVLESGYYSRKTVFFKNDILSRIFLFWRKIDPCHFSNFQAEENLFIFRLFQTSPWEKYNSNPPGCLVLLKFCQNLSRWCTDVRKASSF